MTRSAPRAAAKNCQFRTIWELGGAEHAMQYVMPIDVRSRNTTHRQVSLHSSDKTGTAFADSLPDAIRRDLLMTFNNA